MGFTYQFKSQSSYTFKRYVGSGGCADVLLYSRLTPGLPDQDVILKVLKTQDEPTLRELINDGECLARLKHPNILSTFGFERTEGQKLALLLEYFPGKSLNRLIPHMSSSDREDLASYLISTILQAMHAAHRQGIIHGDISGRNILVSDQGQIKLTDFGLGTIKTSEHASIEDIKGSIDYFAPERWCGAPSSEKSDIFSLGILAFEILSGRQGLGEMKVRGGREILENFLSQEAWRHFAGWRPFFEAALARDPQNRLSADELLKTVPNSSISHPECQMVLSECASFNNGGRSVNLKTLCLKSIAVGRRISKRARMTVYAAGLAMSLLIFCQTLPCEENAVGKIQPLLLTLTSRPWGSVYIDSQFKGYTPIVRLPVNPGYHEIIWRAPNGTEVKRSLQAYKTRQLHYKILLEKTKGSTTSMSPFSTY